MTDFMKIDDAAAIVRSTEEFYPNLGKEAKLMLGVAARAIERGYHLKQEEKVEEFLREMKESEL